MHGNSCRPSSSNGLFATMQIYTACRNSGGCPSANLANCFSMFVVEKGFFWRSSSRAIPETDEMFFVLFSLFVGLGHLVDGLVVWSELTWRHGLTCIAMRHCLLVGTGGTQSISGGEQRDHLHSGHPRASESLLAEPCGCCCRCCSWLCDESRNEDSSSRSETAKSGFEMQRIVGWELVYLHVRTLVTLVHANHPRLDDGICLMTGSSC